MKDFNNMFRPRDWDSVKGQNHITNILKSQVINKKGLSNAYLFSGKSGVGKTTVARLFFMSLNCEKLDKYGNPCFKCLSCKNFKYDLIEINASNNRGIEDIRTLSKEIYYKSPVSKFKGILLDECHLLTSPAWNCLLKPLEDSPDNFVWLLCTTEINKVIKTIQTRCQTFKFTPIRWTDIFERVKEVAKALKIDIDEKTIWAIARNSNTNLREPLHLLEKYVNSDNVSEILSDEINIDFLDSIAKNDLTSIWKSLMSWRSKYSDIDTFISFLKYDVMTCLQMKMGLPLVDIAPYRQKTYQSIAGEIKEEVLLLYFEELLNIEEKLGGVFDYNSLFFNMLCKIKNKNSI